MSSYLEGEVFGFDYRGLAARTSAAIVKKPVGKTVPLLAVKPVSRFNRQLAVRKRIGALKRKLAAGRT